ncbi:MAG: hypothetical protein K8U03_17725 [Planctomycetia bacterium]|nr:hypothetical protein [Planctomycetia bacterium]
MNVTADEIERIVRDVMSRLASERSVGPKTVETETKQAVVANELVVEGRVVALEDLRGRLPGIARLSIAERAIVTPAVRDLLREKKIALVRRAAGAGSATVAMRTIVVAAAEAKIDTSRLTRDLRSEGCKVEQLAQTGLAAAVRELSDEVAKGGAIGLLVTDEADVALVVLNRRVGVRAVGGDDAATIERAARAVGANVFVVRSVRFGGMQIKRWLKSFAVAVSVPAKYEAILK